MEGSEIQCPLALLDLKYLSSAPNPVAAAKWQASGGLTCACKAHPSALKFWGNSSSVSVLSLHSSCLSSGC